MILTILGEKKLGFHYGEQVSGKSMEMYIRIIQDLLS